MSCFYFLFVFALVCVSQNANCQYLGPAPGLGYGPPMGPGPLGYYPGPVVPECGAYGGAGVGDVAVAGELPVVGSTVVAGQVPVLGAVRFAGSLPAAGVVSISGGCSCGCGAPGPAGYYY